MSLLAPSLSQPAGDWRHGCLGRHHPLGPHRLWRRASAVRGAARPAALRHPALQLLQGELPHLSQQRVLRRDDVRKRMRGRLLRAARSRLLRRCLLNSRTFAWPPARAFHLPGELCPSYPESRACIIAAKPCPCMPISVFAWPAQPSLRVCTTCPAPTRNSRLCFHCLPCMCKSHTSKKGMPVSRAG